MKSKLSWIPFIPLAIAAFFFKIAQGKGTVFGLSTLTMDYLYLGCVALIFLFALIFSLADKKISDYYLTRRNLPAGICGVLLALTLAVEGTYMLILAFRTGKADILGIAGAVLALFSAIVFVIFGLNNAIFVKESRHAALLNVVPALYCAVRMILSFVDFTTVSIRLADVSRLICYIFATLFFFNYAVILSRTKTKKAVKYCFVYGLPAVAVTLPYGFYTLIFRFDSEQILNNVQPIEIILIGLYVLSFLIEMTVNVLDRDSVSVVIEEEPEIDLAEEKVEGFFASAESEDEIDRDPDDSAADIRDTEDFLYQDTKQVRQDEEVNEESKNDIANYVTAIQEEEDKDESKKKNYDERLDEIDKLIIEITEKID